MEKKEMLIVSVLAIFAVVCSSLLYFSSDSNNYLTGNAIVSGGQSDDAGDKETANPEKGVIKGTVTYTIKDSGTIINSEYAENATIYLAKQQNTVSDFSKVVLSSKKFKSNTITVDVDGSNSRCSSNNYETTLNYYDENSNGEEEGSEFEVYKTTTDENGCYAAKLKGGNYDLYL